MPEPALARLTGWGVLGWGVLVLSIVVRGGVFFAARGSLQSDPDGYRALAENLLEFGVYGNGRQPTAYRPPLYPLLLTPCAAISNATASRAAIVALHIALGVAACVLTFWLGRAWGLGRYSAFAAALTACDPLLLNQSTLVMTETLAAFLVCAALCALTRAWRSRSARSAALAGLILGLAALCRPTLLAWAVLVAGAWAWTARKRSPRWFALGALLAGLAAPLTVWAIRNQLQFGRPIISTTHGGYTLLLGNNPSYYAFLQTRPAGEVWQADKFDHDVLAARKANADDELRADRREAAQAWQTIRQQPTAFLKACLARLCKFWGVLPHRTANESGLRCDMLRYVTAAWYVGEFALAAVGLGVLRTRALEPPWLWAILLAAALTCTHALYWSDMRMRSPLMPAIALFAACGAASLCRRKMPAAMDLKSTDSA